MLDAPSRGARTSGDDTRAAVAMLREAGVDLIVFAGGDGTARDVLDVAGTAVPVLGIPAGVKMHSGVFATTPTHAGDLLGRIYGPRPSIIALRELEVMDVDEQAYREGRVSATLYGYLLVPYERRLIQGPKRGRARSDDAATDAIATQVIEDLDDHTLYLFGGGTTTRRVFERLGIEKTLLGVDALVGRRPVGRDLAEHEILELLDQTESARVVVSVIGSQGYVLGRGNQQLSPAVLRRVGRDGLIVLATPAKLAGLEQQRLLADTGDVELDASLTGYIPVRTGVRTTTVMHLTS
jgi:predicted polyphosphate/ATP-dependent NAD kinase